MILDSGSAAGSLTVLVLDSGTAGLVDANASVVLTDANDREKPVGLKAGRAVAKSREARRADMMNGQCCQEETVNQLNQW